MDLGPGGVAGGRRPKINPITRETDPKIVQSGRFSVRPQTYAKCAHVSRRHLLHSFTSCGKVTCRTRRTCCATASLLEPAQACLLPPRPTLKQHIIQSPDVFVVKS
eukprot:4801831-Pyramimonas_sp.AAC.1